MLTKTNQAKFAHGNLLIDASGTRLCRACFVARGEAYKAKLRAATKARKAGEAC